MAWVIGIMAVTVLAGQFVAIPLYIVLYMKRWGGYGWVPSIGYGAAGLVVLYGFYHRALHVFFYPSLLFG